MTGNANSGRRRTINYQAAIAYHADGKPLRWIAHTLGCSHATIRRALNPQRQAYEAAYWRKRG